MAVTDAELAGLEAGAAAVGISLPQFVRTRCGFHPRNAPMPGSKEREREEDDAWDRLVRLGIDPKLFFDKA